MMRVLLLSVGGSDSPLVKCINQYKPDYLLFFCSEDVGTNKGSRNMVDGDLVIAEEQRPNIISQCNIDKDKYEIHMVPHDEPYKNYEVSLYFIDKYLNDNHEVIVDYTGGTKSMSVGLAAAAMEFPNCNLSVVKGKRLDLIKVRNGMERVSRLPSNTVFLNRQKRISRSLIKNWDYNGAVKILEEIDRLGYIDNEEQFERLLFLCRGFAAWDKFDFWNAVEKIDIYKDDPLISGLNKRLKQICATIKWYKEWTSETKNAPPVFVLVYDILLNADRRASQGNYDDAVARIYRALEMYGQFCLMTGEPKLISDEIDINKIPKNYREYYENKRNNKGLIQLGLRDNFDLLYILDHSIKPVWEEYKERIIFVLEKRNYSFLAHGMNPIKSEDYNEMRDVVWNFIIECDKAQGIKSGLKDMNQFPLEI